MKVYQISLVNAIVLIGLGIWAYMVSDTPSVTALIPVFLGTIILVLNPGVKNEKKGPSHVVVILTLLVTIGLVMPLTAAIGRDDMPAMIRVVVMMLSSILAIVWFVKSFRAVRRARREQ
jgi:protein-S-isoprenylcysteine O-methyltransferase Ste14